MSDGNDKMKAAIPNTTFMNVIREHLDQLDKLQDELEAIEEEGDDVEEMYEEISLDYEVSEVAEDSEGGEENTIDAEE